MARIRTVKPDLFRHEELFEAECDSGLPLRVAFIALFTACDREGRFKWRPRQLKLDCLPYDQVDFSRVLDALMTRGFVVKYEVSGVVYGCIPSFLRHQSINNKESESSYPAPPNNLSVSGDKEPAGGENQGLEKDDSRVLDALMTRDGKDQGEGEREGREGEREREEEGKEIVAVATTTTTPPGHEKELPKKRQGTKKPKSVIPQDWSPSDRGKELLSQSGIPQDFWLGLIGEFVLYWEERQEARAGWDATFLSHAKRQWAQISSVRASPNTRPVIDGRFERSVQAGLEWLQQGGAK